MTSFAADDSIESILLYTILTRSCLLYTLQLLARSSGLFRSLYVILNNVCVRAQRILYLMYAIFEKHIAIHT